MDAASCELSEAQARSGLLYSLSDSRIQRPPRKRGWIIVFPALGVAILVSVWIGVFELIPPARTDDPITPWVVFVWVLIGIFCIAPLRTAFAYRLRQIRAISAEEALTKRDLRRPILYLRSFNFDDKFVRASGLELAIAAFVDWYTPTGIEEKLAQRLQKFGPLIAIGRPGEDLPTLGAARFYIKGNCWQEKIKEILPYCQYVVWASGLTPGLRWELEHMLRTVDPTRIILWAHPHQLRMKPGVREKEWQKFRQELGAHFPKPFPARLGEAHFFCFDAQFNPIAIGGNKYAMRPGADAIKSLTQYLRGKTNWHSFGFRTENKPLSMLIGYLSAFVSTSVIALVFAWWHYSQDPERFYFYLRALIYPYAFILSTTGMFFVCVQCRVSEKLGGLYTSSVLFFLMAHIFYLSVVGIVWGSPWIHQLWLMNVASEFGRDPASRFMGWLTLLNALISMNITFAISALPFAILLRILPFGPARPLFRVSRTM